MAIVFGYFGVTLVSEVDVASIIWNTLQIIMYIAGGIMQMYMSCMWLVNDYRHNKIRKIDILQKFKAYAESKIQDGRGDPCRAATLLSHCDISPQRGITSPTKECMGEEYKENVGNN